MVIIGGTRGLVKLSWQTFVTATEDDPEVQFLRQAAVTERTNILLNLGIV